MPLRFLRDRVAQAVVVVSVLSAPVVSCATDEIVAWELPAGSGGTLPAADGGPITPPRCGNGVLDDGEGCDDGNTAGGDGCSAACAVEGSGAIGCPGVAIPLTAKGASSRVGRVSGDTSSSGSSFESVACGGGSSKDAVYSFTPDIAGRARVVLDAAFDAYVAARTSCIAGATEIACKPTPTAGGKSEIVFPIAAKQTAFVIVDGVGGKQGAYTVDVQVDAVACGDALAQWPEQCDDGNTVAGDGCSASCMLETPLSAPGRCPGASYTLVGSAAGPRTVSFAGDVSTLASTASSLGCTSGGGKDQVYAITPTISGSLKAVLRASYPEAQLHARRECFASQTQLDCRAQPLASVPLELAIPVVAQSTYFVFVDSDSTSPGGTYTLDVTLSPPVCGNGSLERPEECDDGNVAAGDGCAADCSLEAPPAGVDSCPGAAISFAGAPGGPLSFHTTASTAPLTAGVRAACGATGTKDAAYTFVAPYDGWLEARAKGAFNVALDLRNDCVLEGGAAGSSVACADVDKGNGQETVKGAIEGGATYTLVVKGGVGANEGAFSLDVNLRPSVCGNNVIEGGETCDDGANDPGDGCDATCQIEPTPATRTTCANAEALALVEAPAGVFTATASGGNWHMSDSATFSAPCAATGRESYFTVTPPIDGVVTARTVSTYNISLGARSACPPFTSTGFLTCSDKRTPAGETISFAATAGTKYWIIVDAPTDNDRGRFTLDVTVKAASCGDGLVSGAEQCDDGNTVAGDGCSATCTLEPLAGLDVCPGRAVTLAGVGTAPRHEVVSLSTAALASNYAGTCGGNGRDGVIAVTSDVSGTMRALLTSAWPSVLYARGTCTNGASERGCDEADLAKPNETTRELSFAVTGGVPTYLFIDGLSGGFGPATLSLTVTP